MLRKILLPKLKKETLLKLTNKTMYEDLKLKFNKTTRKTHLHRFLLHRS